MGSIVVARAAARDLELLADEQIPNCERPWVVPYGGLRGRDAANASRVNAGQPSRSEPYAAPVV